MATQLKLILASGSPQRRQLMQEAGYQFEVMIPDDSAECGVCSSTGPAELVSESAFRKAADVTQRLLSDRDTVLDGQVVIACDTVAQCSADIFGKPSDEEHARQMLCRLNGKVHRVFSGLCVWQLFPDRRSVQPEVRIATTELKMDVLSEEQIEEYLVSGQWQGKAGALGYQDQPGWLHITRGSESNVIGLPMDLLATILQDIRV